MNQTQITVKTIPQTKIAADLLAIPVQQAKTPKAVIETFVPELDKALKGRLQQLAQWENFTGEFGSHLAFFTDQEVKAHKAILFGVGEAAKWNLDILRQAAGQLAKTCMNGKGRRLAIAIPRPDASLYRYSASPEEIAQAVVEGVLLGCYQFKKYRKDKNKSSPLVSLQLISPHKSLEKSLRLGMKRGEIFARATAQARDLVNEPPSRLTPKILAGEAIKMLKNSGIGVSVLGPKEIKKLGMNAFLAVSQGSNEPPALIRMQYKCKRPQKKHIVLIGKGVTFDSGGLSLKPAKNMETMKDDMAGAAAVIATMASLAQLKPSTNVTGLVLATENLVDANSIKPGDVVKAFNGKTVEILNTDAEGRLTLADALAYAEKTLKADQMIDLATLTGACLVALGTSISALLGNSETLMSDLKEAGKRAGENLWELPLFEGYRDLLKSDIADLKNIGGSYGGTITASLFLSEFVEKADWAHLDIAGPAWSEKESGYLSKGGTGVGVRTLLNYLCAL